MVSRYRASFTARYFRDFVAVLYAVFDSMLSVSKVLKITWHCCRQVRVKISLVVCHLALRKKVSQGGRNQGYGIRYCYGTVKLEYLEP